MANFHSAVLTKDGIELLAKAQSGLTAIEFTKTATGDGVYAEGESLMEKTALKSQKQEFPINTLSIVNDATVYLKFIITNKQESGDLTAGYYVKEVGVFANDPDKGEILYSIAIAVTDQWDYLPAYNSLLPSTITMEFYTEVANAETVYITASDGVYVLQEDFDQTIAQIYQDMNVSGGISPADDNMIYLGRELTEFSWEELSDIAKAGTTAEHDIHVGDYKTLTLSHTERDITTEYPIRMQVAGINTYAAFDFKSNYPKHHIDWISIELYPPNTYIWNESGNNDLVTSNMPCPMHNCIMRSYLGQIASDDLPDGFKDLIVSKYMYMEEKYDEKDPSSLTSATGASANTIDWLWLPSEFEIFGTVAYGSMRWASIGQIQYPLFANGGQVNRIKAIVVEEGRVSNVPWWTMTITEGTTTEVACITENGVVGTANVLTKLNIPICFRL